ncbi:MAG TPA: hypothetical protein VNV66_01240 [Pilimelia sp.]|nr:hypothetical protein [Pilimelia sp.]
MYERMYWLRKIPNTQNSSIVGQVKRYWRDNDYVIRIEDLNPRSSWTLAARNRTTGFKMDLKKSTSGELSLGAQSPRVDEPGGRPS